MNRLIRQSVVAVASLLLAGTIVSCEKKTNSVLPEFGGDIKLDRTKIGLGQKVTATYVVPVGGQDIEPLEMSWNYDNKTVSDNNIPQDGVSTVNFMATGGVGEHTLEFVRQYINLELGKATTGRKTGKLTVVACDVLTSFWNDSKAVVLATADETFENPKAELLEAPILGPTGTKAELRQYHFTADKLDNIRRIVLEQAVPGMAVGLINLRTKAMERSGYTPKSFDIISIATGNVTPFDMARLNDPLYTIPISTDVENGHLELRSVLQNNKTKVTLSYSLKAGLLFNIVTYTSL